jgi:crotonobetainyl-CoA:carnitine CoA-transferase CaiB-like acyl-CoA transferase
MKDGLGALAGLRVLDLTRFIAGPHCAMVLADLGADVVKVERPRGGDDTRAIAPHVGGESIYFMVFNRNKRSIAIDLRDPVGQSPLRDLVRQADVLIENFRPGTMEKMGCGWTALEAINPRLVMARISGFGQTGGDEPCFDAVAQAGSGLMAITGQPDGPPTMAGTCIVDYAAGLHATIGILAAIEARHRTGHGQVVDVSLMGSAVSLLMTAIPEQRLCGREMTRAGNQDRYAAPGQTFRAADGTWIHIVGGNDGPFPRLAAAIGRLDLPSQARFATIPARVRNRTELDAIVEAWAAARRADDVLATLARAGVPAARVATVAEVASSQQMRDRGFVVDVPHEAAGAVPMQGMPIRLSATPGAIRTGSPRLGQHMAEVTAEWLGHRHSAAPGPEPSKEHRP